MAWLNILADPALRESYSFGDKPYGEYWKETPDEQVPVPSALPLQPTLADVIAVLPVDAQTQLSANLAAKVKS